MIFDKRVLIFTPTALPSITGNAVTAERWRRLLVERGAMVQVLPMEGIRPINPSEIIREFKPDIIHCHHAIKTGSFFLEGHISKKPDNIPLVVSLPGTDINIGILEKRKVVEQVLNMASAIICQGKNIEDIIKKEFPDVINRTFFVPKSPIWFGNIKFSLRERAGCSRDDILFFHPAGIRPVKANFECMEYFKEVNRIRPEAKIVFAGPGLDRDYTRRFEEYLKMCMHFASWIPTIPLEGMKSAYEDADIVLNTSVSEGISTVLLEAVYAGKSILASDIPGNRLFLTSLNNSAYWNMLYNPSDPDDFVKKAIQIIENREPRYEYTKNVNSVRSSLPGHKEEAEGLITAYRSAQGVL